MFGKVGGPADGQANSGPPALIVVPASLTVPCTAYSALHTDCRIRRHSGKLRSTGALHCTALHHPEHNCLWAAFRWCEFRVKRFEGKSRDSILCDLDRGQLEIVIATYDTIRGEQYGHDILKHPWRLVICDEVHTLKNDKSKTVAKARQLRTNKRQLLPSSELPFHTFVAGLD